MDRKLLQVVLKAALHGVLCGSDLDFIAPEIHVVRGAALPALEALAVHQHDFSGHVNEPHLQRNLPFDVIEPRAFHPNRARGAKDGDDDHVGAKPLAQLQELSGFELVWREGINLHRPNSGADFVGSDESESAAIELIVQPTSDGSNLLPGERVGDVVGYVDRRHDRDARRSLRSGQNGKDKKRKRGPVPHAPSMLALTIP